MNKRSEIYVIMKGGMYLMSFQPSGITEFDNTGKLVSVYTGVWCDKKRDARVFEDVGQAKKMADLLEASLIKVVLK